MLTSLWRGRAREECSGLSARRMQDAIELRVAAEELQILVFVRALDCGSGVSSDEMLLKALTCVVVCSYCHLVLAPRTLRQ